MGSNEQFDTHERIKKNNKKKKKKKKKKKQSRCARSLN